MKLKKQLFLLYGYEVLSNFGLSHVIWVLLLVGRGFSLAQVGVAEGVFHLVSFLCEVPSGMVADLLGRKRTLAASRVLALCSCLCMVALDSFLGVCLSLSLSALGYNLASGTREAITYDSLLMAGEEASFEAVSARQAMAWRVASGGSALLTGVALFVGWRAAHMIDAVIAVLALALVLCLQEPTVTEAQKQRTQNAFANIWPRLRRHIVDSVGFLVKHPRTCAKMFVDAALACAAYLASMMLQQYYVELGLPDAVVGLPILANSLAGVAGAALAPRIKTPVFRVFLLSSVIIGGSLALCSVPVLTVVLVAGCAVALVDAILEVKISAHLNEGFPSDQRATLVSSESLCYSLLMLPASPALGSLCDAVGIGNGLAVMGVGLAVGILLCGWLYANQAKKRQPNH